MVFLVLRSLNRWLTLNSRMLSRGADCGPLPFFPRLHSHFCSDEEVRDAFGDMWSEWVAVKCFETEERHLKENRADAMKCDTMTAYLPSKKQYVPCIYWLLRDYDGEEAYGCVTGWAAWAMANVRGRCFSKVGSRRFVDHTAANL